MNMSSEKSEIGTLIKRFEDVTKRLEEVLEDIEWRKADVAHEEAKLKELLKQREKGELVDTYSQSEVVRIGKEILADRIAEAERLEKEMLDIKGRLEKLTGEKEKEEKRE